MEQSIIEQGKALAQMHGDTLDHIAKYAAEFRQIINDFQKLFGRIPTADDLLWCASVNHKHNIREG